MPIVAALGEMLVGGAARYAGGAAVRGLVAKGASESVANMGGAMARGAVQGGGQHMIQNMSSRGRTQRNTM